FGVSMDTALVAGRKPDFDARTRYLPAARFGNSNRPSGNVFKTRGRSIRSLRLGGGSSMTRACERRRPSALVIRPRMTPVPGGGSSQSIGRREKESFTVNG